MECSEKVFLPGGSSCSRLAGLSRESLRYSSSIIVNAVLVCVCVCAFGLLGWVGGGEEEAGSVVDVS